MMVQVVIVFCQQESNFHIHNIEIWRHNIECDDLGVRATSGATGHAQLQKYPLLEFVYQTSQT